jgi:hypothetical protein
MYTSIDMQLDSVLLQCCRQCGFDSFFSGSRWGEENFFRWRVESHAAILRLKWLAAWGQLIKQLWDFSPRPFGLITLHFHSMSGSDPKLSGVRKKPSSLFASHWRVSFRSVSPIFFFDCATWSKKLLRNIEWKLAAPSTREWEKKSFQLCVAFALQPRLKSCVHYEILNIWLRNWKCTKSII